MNKWILRCPILVTWLVALALLKAEKVRPKTPLYRVINGRDAREDEFPFVVAIVRKFIVWVESKQKHYELYLRLCTGSLITSEFVVTAAHCVVPSATHVRCGNMSKPMHETECKSEILKRFAHPGHNIGMQNDIGLIKIKPLIIKHYGTLLIQDYKTLIGRVVQYAGFGRMDTKSDLLSLMKLTLKPLQIGEGILLDFFDHIHPLLIIAPKCSQRYQRVNHGDSGGPLLLGGKIMGVATAYINLQRPDIKSGFTPVSPYTDWIMHIINVNKY